VHWLSGVVLFVIIWWTALFAVLPIGTQPVQTPDDASGWRGAPAKPRLLKKMLLTTVVSVVLWGGAYWLITSDYLSFRHGILAIPDDTPARTTSAPVR
jgi:predicted secreted protein